MREGGGIDGLRRIDGAPDHGFQAHTGLLEEICDPTGGDEHPARRASRIAPGSPAVT
jgi:hypothetical protein